MNENKKPQPNPFGEIIQPIFELLNLIILKLMDLFFKGSQKLLLDIINFDRIDPLKKIEREDLTIKTTTKDNDSFGYSITRKKDLKTVEIDKKAHSAIVGASGSGKTSLIDTLIFGDLTNNKTVLFIDPKGSKSALEQFVNLCKYNSANYQIFSTFYQGESKLSINPVKSGSTTQIADRVFKAFTWSEEYYASKCYQALRIAISELKKANKVITLERIYTEIIKIAESKEQKFQKVNPSEIDGILTKLENINNSDFGPIINNPNGLSFYELRERNSNTYVGVQVLGYPEIARAIGKIFLGDIATSVNQTYEETGIEDNLDLNPISLYIDELGAVITPDFVEILNKCRGSKLELTTAMQTPHDIDRVDVNLTQQVWESSSNWFVMRQRMRESSSMISESIGTMESLKQTVRIDDGEEQTQGSQRKVEELIVHSNIIKSLKQGQCVLLRQNPMKVDLINVKYIDPLDVLSNLRLMNLKGGVKIKNAREEVKESFVEI